MKLTSNLPTDPPDPKEGRVSKPLRARPTRSVMLPQFKERMVLPALEKPPEQPVNRIAATIAKTQPDETS